MTRLIPGEATVVSTSPDIMVLEFNGQKIQWPANEAPENIKPGDRLLIILTDKKTWQLQSENQSKSILNEILHGSEKEEDA